MRVKTNKEREQEKARGKKRYRERIAEEREAKQEIKEYEHEDIPDERGTDRLDGFRSERS